MAALQLVSRVTPLPSDDLLRWEISLESETKQAQRPKVTLNVSVIYALSR